jgi:pSer/pThr/pTyr-binding forkhead associated (FHA) protein
VQHRYTLSVSTGDVVEVSGSGLVGRRPITQPGEHVDQLVVVSDPTRSVSKTHLEFGLEGDELWICDRYSGNGTIAHPLGGVPRQCEAGRRYRVTRGTRVEIGDQWFDVS